MISYVTYDIICTMISLYKTWYHSQKYDITSCEWYHNTNNDIIFWCHGVISYMISCNMISYVTSYVTSCMISCIWYHMPGASVLMYRTYDILVWYHNIWYHRCASFFWIYFWISMHKNIQNAPCWCKDSNPDLHTERQPI
jgi:hypothetical protein